MLNAQAVARSTSREKLATRWVNLRNRLARANDAAVEVAWRGGEVVVGHSTFAGLFTLHEYREAKGQRNTFDKGGKVNAYYWPGLLAAVFGVSPWSGKGGRLLVSAGVSAMNVGSIDALRKFARDLATKK